MTIPPEFWILPPLAIAAGIDLYLTLLLLGAAPTTALWEQPLPGALSDLDSPSVLIVVGIFYLLEFAADRHPAAALVWNAFHAIIRPLSGTLLALLVLDGQPTATVVVGSAACGAMTSLAHSARSGWAVTRWLAAATAPRVLFVSLLEDVLVLGLVVLALDRPLWALGSAVAGVALLSWRIDSDVRAFVFAVRLAVGRIFQTLAQRRWLGSDGLPQWVRSAIDHQDFPAPGGAVRGTPVGAYRLPGSPRFVTGWVLVRGGSAVLLYRRHGSAEVLELAGLELEEVAEQSFFRRADLRTEDDTIGRIFFPLSGPSRASLRAEFGGSE